MRKIFLVAVAFVATLRVDAIPAFVTPERMGAYYGADKGLYGSLAVWQDDITTGAALGLGIVRCNTDAWELMEPRRGEYNWKALDAYVDMTTSAGLSPIITLPISASWNRPEKTGTHTPTEDLKALTLLAREIAARYRGRVKYYEAWNEPDNPAFWDGGPDVNGYLGVLEAVFMGVRAGDATAYVLLGGLADPADKMGGGFLKQLLGVGGGKFFDVMNIHVYPALGTLEAGLREARTAGKPIIITEISSTGGVFDTADKSSEEKKKSVFFIQNYVKALFEGDVLGIVWHTLRNPTEYDFGLIENDAVKLDAYKAHQLFSSKLMGAEVLGPCYSWPGISFYSFRKNGHEFHVVWGNGTKTAQSLLPGSVVTDCLGVSVPGSTAIGADPLYLQVK